MKTSKNTLQKQQWTKYLSVYYAEALRLSNPISPLKKAYMNTYHCNKVKYYNGEVMTSTYCKNRWCLTCNRIKTAININHYSPQICEMAQPFFVTLTRPTIKIEELQNRITEMEQCWRSIYKASLHKKGALWTNFRIKLKGVRKMECTIRPNDKYHYHFHIIVDGWYCAEWLQSEWLKRNPDADIQAQDIRVCDKNAILEVMKYTTKMTSKIIDIPNFRRLDELFQALKGKRTLAPFGGLKVPKKSAEEDFELQAQFQSELNLRFGAEKSIWNWQKEIFDWVNEETGECLIGKDIPEKILIK